MNAQDVLRRYQKQCDPEGIEVQVSRQALDETLDEIERLTAEVAKMKAALEAAAKVFEREGDRRGAALMREAIPDSDKQGEGNPATCDASAGRGSEPLPDAAIPWPEEATECPVCRQESQINLEGTLTCLHCGHTVSAEDGQK